MRLETTMATLFENSIIQNTRCFSCGSLVYAVEKKITTKHVYHNRCFRCRICKRNLTGYSLNEEGDDIYCGNCYRKKQRGDCNSLEFHRAAAEKALYVHNRQPKTEENLFGTSRSSRLRDTVRNPSLTLRHLERQFRSYQPSNGTHNNEPTDEINQQPLTTSIPLKLNTSFSTPNNFTSLRRDSPLIKAEGTPRFESILSPSLTRRTETIITPHLTQPTDEKNTNDEQDKPIILPTANATCGIEFRLNKSNNDIGLITSPLSIRKNIIIPDLNQNDEQITSKFRFPEFNIKEIHRRSCSAHHATHPSSRIS
ncbi:unnamed protein product [Rotaria magnacalcarata]|uniref:LIM zinc-binding domain-containing protein n=2 Tax=Rotaria magnacalcarata TaxID=392030 RepID=A0A816MD19_9BILA|nr:unnamed protein product [Rotaria magnacalcarata]CAF4092185.1 unnamed protein product [Rotaria magnacalcarata]CAF4133218.1 unnamed protein product [Rotaria magnacalcarata]